MINSPNNPTGWTMPREQQRAVLAHCRATGTWIIADEVYHQLHFPAGQGAAAGPAPSFLEHAAADDRLVVAHSFSKSFWMTGWRLGALIAPPALMGALGKLLEFNTSCAPVFVQRGGLAALAHADALVDAVRRQLLAARPVLLDALTALPGAQVPQPDGAMYVFFRLVGHDDSLAVAKRLVLEAGLGVAPGSAFGAAGRGWLRWCYAGAPERMREGAARLARWLEAQRLRAAA
jgi:aspartate/methionine/tyrosine aminotransferase